MTGEEIKTKDDAVIALAAADKRFHDHKTNRKLRFADITKKGVRQFNSPSS